MLISISISNVSSLSALKLGDINFSELLTPQNIIFFTGKGCLLIAAIFSYLTAESCALSLKQNLKSLYVNPQLSDLSHAVIQPIDSYNVISQRNIFGKADASTTQAKVPAPRSSLKLRLVGITVGPKGIPLAIIENTHSHEQDVFLMNDDIFKQAKLVEVLLDHVRIEHNGRIETLEIEEGKRNPVPTHSDTPVSGNSDGSEFVVTEDELSRQLANLPKLLSQARAVPYFRNGKSIGMRLFAIRRGSLYEKLGLKNGDILLSINENNLNDPSQALKLFNQLKTEKEINVSVERSGTKKNIQYTIQ